MIDYVKVRTRQPGFAQNLLSTTHLTFIDYHNGRGEKVGVKATYCALTWYVFGSGLVEMEGSLHKCWNSQNGYDATNWNDFRRLDLFDVLDWLTQGFGLVLASAMLHNVEFGVNLCLPPAPPTVRDLLSRLLFYGKGQAFVDKPVDRGCYKRMDSSDFYVKAYDKGAQYGTPDQRLRFEKGVICMKELNPPKRPALLTTLADLTDPARLDQLGSLLLTTYDRCFWAEQFDSVTLTPAEQKTVDLAHNVATWPTLTRIRRHRLRTDYDRIADRCGYRISTYIREQISIKWTDLLELDCNVLRRGGMKRFTHLENGVKRYITSPVEEGSDSQPNEEFSDSIKRDEPTVEEEVRQADETVYQHSFSI